MKNYGDERWIHFQHMSKAVALPRLVFISLPKKIAHIRRRSGQSYMQLKKRKESLKTIIMKKEYKITCHNACLRQKYKFGSILSPIRPRFEFVNLQCFTEIISRELKRIPRLKDCCSGGGGGGGYYHICAAVKGMVFKQFTLGSGI